MLKHTTLHSAHTALGAHLVDFSGWDMPLHYGSQIQEHLAVRAHAGIFDVSHMGVIDVRGEQATNFLRDLLANDVAKLKQPGSALYTCMLNESGGILDDLIVYYVSPDSYRLVVNAATQEKDFAWLQKQKSDYAVNIQRCPDLSIIAVQGPDVWNILESAFDSVIYEKIKTLRPFHFLSLEDLMIARTGYTGEPGVEIILPNHKACDFWDKCVRAGATPCGLGARDTLRLEAGFNLYGTDMDESTTPLNSNLSWTVSLTDFSRKFIGRETLEKELRVGCATQLVGLIMEEPGVLRNHQPVYFDGSGIRGEITSGSFSPTLGYAIAFARIPVHAEGKPYVERRAKRVFVKIVTPPFVRRGKKIAED